MMVDEGRIVSHGLPDGDDGDLEEGDQLANDQPDVDHPDVGGGRQLLHHTDKERGGDQHDGQVHGHGGFEVKPLEVGGGEADTDKEERGEKGGENLVGESPLEPDFHLDPFISIL